MRVLRQALRAVRSVDARDLRHAFADTADRVVRAVEPAYRRKPRRLFHGTNVPGLRKIRPTNYGNTLLAKIHGDRVFALPSPGEALLHSLRKMATDAKGQHLTFVGERGIVVAPRMRHVLSRPAFVYQVDPRPFRAGLGRGEWTTVNRAPRVIRRIGVKNIGRALKKRGWKVIVGDWRKHA